MHVHEKPAILNSRSLDRACSTREAPIRVDKAAERVAANTPIVMNSGITLISLDREEKKIQLILKEKVYCKLCLDEPAGNCSY